MRLDLSKYVCSRAGETLAFSKTVASCTRNNMFSNSGQRRLNVAAYFRQYLFLINGTANCSQVPCGAQKTSNAQKSAAHQKLTKQSTSLCNKMRAFFGREKYAPRLVEICVLPCR